jgi:hypothetical protein
VSGLLSGLVNAGTAAATGYAQGDAANLRALLAERARRAQAQRDKEEMDLKRIATLGAAAGQGLTLTPAPPPSAPSPPPPVSRRDATGAAPVSPEGGREAVSVRVAGQLEPGNIDLTHRPRVTNPDGSISTVRSMSANIDGREVLLPTVSDDGRLLSNDEAIAEYQRTGKHLGVFADPASATAYAQQLHGAQADLLDGRGNGTVAPVKPTGDAPPATADGTPIGEVAGVRVAVPPGGLQSRTAREAQQKLAQAESDRRTRLQSFNDALPPGDARRMSPTLIEMLARNEGAYAKQVEKFAGLGTPDPVAVHRANRDYDVQHPLPPQEGADRTMVLVQDPENPDGPGVYVPRAQAMGQHAPGKPKAENAMNTAASARLHAAVSEMNNAHAGMDAFEQGLASGRISINGLEQFLGATGNSFTHDDPASRAIQSAALSVLNRTNPELARYIRRGLSFAEGESMISQRPSDFRTKMTAFLSQASSGASPEMIADIQSRRKAILDPLNATVQPTPARGGPPGRGTVQPQQGNAPHGNVNLGPPKTATPAQKVRAARDPEYRQYLLETGIRF